jgi:hypothetical protein
MPRFSTARVQDRLAAFAAAPSSATCALKEIWAIRVRLQFYGRIRDLALFNLAIDSKLRACDLVRLRVRDVSHG